MLLAVFMNILIWMLQSLIIIEKISKELKQIFVLGDFNIDLLNYNVHEPTNDFLNCLASNSIVPYI